MRFCSLPREVCDYGAQVFFGWNLAAMSLGTVAVGDELVVKKTRTAASALAA